MAGVGILNENNLHQLHQWKGATAFENESLTIILFIISTIFNWLLSQKLNFIYVTMTFHNIINICSSLLSFKILFHIL